MQMVYLIGLMGSGKTYWGRKLAHHTNSQFIDLDEWIEQQEGVSIAGIFAEYGEAHFRQMETEALRKIATVDRAVVSTGGGTPCFEKNMEYMLKQGVVVWLNATTGTIADRIWKNRERRPLIAGVGSKEELIEILEQLLAKRAAFYSRAHITIADEAIDLSELVAAIHHQQYLKQA
jgi:shikimate kinase